MAGRPPPLRLRAKTPSPTLTKPPKICDCPILENEESLDKYFIFESYAPLSQAGAFGFVVGALAKPAFETLTNETFKRIDLEPVDLGMQPVVVKEISLVNPSHLEEVKQETRIMRYLMLLKQRDPALTHHLPAYYGCFTAIKDGSPVAYIVMDRILGADLKASTPLASPFDLREVSPFGDALLEGEATKTDSEETKTDGKALLDSESKGSTRSKQSKALGHLKGPLFAKPVEVFDLILSYHEDQSNKDYLKHLCSQVFIPLAKTLAALHSHGVVHGDVKPSNLMFGHTGRGGSGVPSPVGTYLIDFGHTCLNPALVSALKLTSYPTCTRHPLGATKESRQSIWYGDFSSIDIGLRYKTYKNEPVDFEDFLLDDWWGWYYTVFATLGGNAMEDNQSHFEEAALREESYQEAISSFRAKTQGTFEYYLKALKLIDLCPPVWRLMKLIGGSPSSAQIRQFANNHFK